MKNNQEIVRVIGNSILSAMLAMSATSVSVFAQEKEDDVNPTEKTETVYTVLNADGSVNNTIVSSWIHDEDGIHGISEQLALKDVKNVKTDEKPKIHDDTYTWNVKGNDVYYQGTSNQQLPVRIQISYAMDGKEMSLDEMQGKSGHATITVKYQNMISEQTASGTIVHPAYLAGGILNLDTDNYTNVSCSSGKVISDGNNQIVTIVAVPGLEETLNSAGLHSVVESIGISDTCTIEADVDHFDVDNLMIGLSSDFDLSELTQIQSMGDLSGSVSQIVNAADLLEDGSRQLYDGTSQLKQKAAPLTNASGQVNVLSDSLVKLNQGATNLNDGVQKYTNGVSLLDQGNKQLYKIHDGVAQVSYAVSSSPQSLEQGAKQLQQGLHGLKQATDQIDPASLDTLSAQIDQSKQTLTTLQSMLEADGKTLDGLDESLKTAQIQLGALASDTTLSDQITAIVKDVTALQNTIDSDNDIVKNYNDNIQYQVNTINTQIDTINGQIATAQTNINSAYEKAITQLNVALTAVGDDEQAQEAINAAINQLGQERPRIGSTIDHISVEGLESLESLDPSGLEQSAQSLQKTISGLSEQLSSMQTSLSKASGSLNGLDQDITKAMGTLNQMSALIQDVKIGDVDYKTMITQLQTAANQLSTGSDQLVDGVDTLSQGLQQLDEQSLNGIDTVNAASQQLASNNESLQNGSQQLKEGTDLLAAQQNTLHSMSQGLQQLGDAFTQLNNGALQLYTGQQQFSEQAMKPLQEMADLAEGELSTLTDTMNEIKSLSNQNKNFAGAPAGAICKVNYVFRIKE